MNSKDFVQALRKAIREEVQVAVRTELNKFGQINESRVVPQPKRQAPPSYLETYKPNKPAEKKQYSKNPILNDILNNTQGMASNEPVAMLEENINYNDFNEWPDMNRGAMPSMQHQSQAASLVPRVDTEGRPINAAAVSDTVVNMLTKDFSAILKKSMDIDKKRGKI